MNVSIQAFEFLLSIYAEPLAELDLKYLRFLAQLKTAYLKRTSSSTSMIDNNLRSKIH